MSLLSFSAAFAVMQLTMAQNICPNSSWSYKPVTGSCYLAVDASSISFSDASASCAAAGAQLVSIDSEEEQAIIDLYLQFNYNNFWIGLVYNVTLSQFFWLDGWPLNLTSRWGPNNPKIMTSNGYFLQPTNLNVYMNKQYTSQVKNAYEIQWLWYSAADTATTVNSYVCEYTGPRCPDVANVTNATASTWKNYYNLTVTWTCFDGYILQLPSDGNYTYDQYFNQRKSCVFNNDAYYWDGPALAACAPKYCYSAPAAFPVGDGYPTCDICGLAPPFGPGVKATYTCPLGYRVPSGNVSTQTVCGTSPVEPLANIWKPQISTCTIVQCPPLYTITASNILQPSGVDLHGVTIKQGASNKLIQYGSVVNITCIPGFIFQDGLVTRRYRCNTVGTQGYWSIVTPDADFQSPGCSAIVCTSMAQQVDAALQSGMFNATSGNYRLTAYKSVFSVTCATGMAFPDGSVTKSFNCDSLQRWNDGVNAYSSIPTCITASQQFADKPGIKYQPPAQESPNATATGTSIFLILGIFLGLILIMDLMVLPRDISILCGNIHRLMDRCKQDKNNDEAAFINNLVIESGSTSDA